MKYIVIIVLFASQLMSAQSLQTNGLATSTITNESPFIDASSFSESGNLAKGLLFPRTDLTTFQFANDGDFFGFSTYYDGMVVFNTATGSTPVAGAGIKSGIGSESVAPGFYYFSNPTGASVEGNGRWIPIGSPANNVVKSKEVFVTTPAVYNEAKLNLGTTVIGPDEVVTFLGAKIYEAGKLIMTADSDYITNTNVLTTGNGYMFQLLKANTQYKVVVEYK